jgi:UDP-N-acetylglucosamine 2-epimerase
MDKKHVILFVGARPNFMKMAPIYNKLIQYNVDVTIVHTEQHKDYNMSDIFLKQFNLPLENIIFLNAKTDSPNIQIADIMIKFEEYIRKCNQIDLIVVFGDVNSTLAGALVSNK